MDFRRILLVDDSPGLVALLTRALSYLGLQIYAAPTGEEALARFTAIDPDVAIIDLNLPGMPGWEACRLMKQQKHIPIILMTGDISIELAEIGRSYDAQDYLRKPFRLEALFTCVQRVLDEAARQTPVKEPMGESCEGALMRAYGQDRC